MGSRTCFLLCEANQQLRAQIDKNLHEFHLLDEEIDIWIKKQGNIKRKAIYDKQEIYAIFRRSTNILGTLIFKLVGAICIVVIRVLIFSITKEQENIITKRMHI